MPGLRRRSTQYCTLPFAPVQIDALIPLVKDIVRRHWIRLERILRRRDVMPRTKNDPGPAFPWQRLADEGLAAWPDLQRVAAQRAPFATALPDAGTAALVQALTTPP